MANESELSLYLSEIGFDNAQYWLANLKEIKILSLASLKLMEGDIKCFKILETKTKYYVEKKALAKLFKIDENQIEMSPTLDMHLHEVGFVNVQFWLGALEKMKITSFASLKLMEGDVECFKMLEKKANYYVERKALAKLLKIDESKVLVKQDLPSLTSSTEEVLKHVQRWSKETVATVDEIQEWLECLWKIRQNIISQESSSKLWVKEYLMNPSMQEFLVTITKYKSDQSSIKSAMQDIIDLEDLNCLSAEAFPQIKELSRWLYSENATKSIDIRSELISFDSLESFMSNTIQEEYAASKPRSPNDLAMYISEGIYWLRVKYKETYDDVFLIILTCPFLKDSTNDVLELKPLKISELQYFYKNFSTQRAIFEVYKSMNILFLQTYLFLLAINSFSEKDDKKIVLFLKQIFLKITDLQPSLEKELKFYLKQCFTSLKVHDLKQILENILLPPCQGRPRLIFESSEACSDLIVDRNFEIITNQYKALALCEDDFSNLANNKEAHELLENLGLCHFYPKKLKLQTALCIREEPMKLSLKQMVLTNPKQLPFLVLHKLMSYDELFRSDLIPALPHQSDYSASDGSESDDDKQKSKEFVNEIHGQEIHPVDILLSLLLISDDILCQDLFSRLAKCQFAIPLVIPNPFTNKLYVPIWAMNSVLHEWESINKQNQRVQNSGPIIKYPTPILSFIRIGKHHKYSPSKSKILNEVIGDSHHDYFFHRDCRGGQYKTILGKGLVDMAWYIPSGKTDTFSDAITFLNLHGDARDHPEQCFFLSKCSSMCIILLTEEEPTLDSHLVACLNDFCSSPGGICILNCVEQDPKKLEKVFSKPYLINIVSKDSVKTAAEIKDALQIRIKRKLKQFQECKSIENVLCQHRTDNMVTDEDSEVFQVGLLHANKIKEIISRSDSNGPENNSNLKDILLPLQGKDLWKAWATYDKEIFRQTHKENEIIQKYTAKINDQRSKIRNNQLQYIENLNPFMKTFIESLLKLSQDNTGRLNDFFLQILKLEFNSISRDHISEKQYEYQKMRKALSKLQNESVSESSNSKEEILTLKKELEILQDEIIDASLGLEHLFRELGQVYEASVEVKGNDTDKFNHEVQLNDDGIMNDVAHTLEYYISCLPKVVAKLVAEGHPLEIMDGDAAHIPLQWVTAVIDEVVKILGDPRVFVLSVLGLQSTGKSTLLNSTFGLQFNVSAGRCTRGAFMQLLPLDENLQQATGCSYVMIVDTEGLRAPELDFQKTQNHDNELSTFVIGLANMTLINIYGEVPGDIDDILQTSVHAFLRMTQVKYYPSCQFVHQNAGVNIKAEVSRAKFTAKLNKFTIAAAQEENCKGFDAFNDVIKFNDQTDVHYFPGLWKGDPPMAPVNLGYSQSAQSLKYHLVTAGFENQDASNNEELKYHCLSSFQIKLNDLWNSLLKENFVFSFKNTLEITAYNSLETAYNKWEWTIQSAMLQWERKAENEISTESSESLSEKVQLKLKELNTYVDRTLYDPIKEEMEQFFKGKQCEILIQWKSKFEIRLNYLLKEVKTHAEHHCSNVLRRKKVISDFEADMQINVEFIKRNVQQIIDIVRREQQALVKSIERRKVGSEELKKLVKKEVFVQHQLSQFLKDKIISPKQVTRIQKMVADNGGQLNKHIIEKIIKADVLSLDQVKKMLIKADQNEDKLWAMFNETWNDLLKNLPKVQVFRGTTIEVEVEKALIKYLEGGKLKGVVIENLKKKTLRQRGSNVEICIKPIKHFIVRGIMAKCSQQIRYIFGTSDPYVIQAHEINDLIIQDAMQYLESKCKEDIDFNAVFITELLQLIDTSIRECSNQEGCIITFTPAYYADVYMTVCGYAMLQFEIMAKTFEDKSNPISYLEKHQKLPLFTKFKNQYKLTEAEESIADTFCAYLEEPITTQINKLLGAKMVDKMKASQHHQFSSKIALKVKILNDLHEENIFSHYMLYIQKIQKCLQERIKDYTIKYCDEVGKGKKTLLQATAEEEIVRMVDAVEIIIANTEEVTVQDLLGKLCKDADLRKELGIGLQAQDLLAGHESLDKLNVESLKSKIIKRLKPLKGRCQEHFSNIKCERAMDSWKDKPHDLLKNLIGCTAQCPFCGEQCDLLEHDDSCDHRTEVHRIGCLAGWRYRETGQMITSICPILIAGGGSFYPTTNSDETVPFKDYKTIHPQWFIPPDVVAKSCSYWKWFVSTHREELEKEYDADGSLFPAEWANIKWNSIKQDLKAVYKLNF